MRGIDLADSLTCSISINDARQELIAGERGRDPVRMFLANHERERDQSVPTADDGETLFITFTVAQKICRFLIDIAETGIFDLVCALFDRRSAW